VCVFFTVTLLPKEKIDPEVVQKLNAIVDVARRATPRTA